MRLGVRWTVGDVSARGWEALRLSVYCAVRLFGADAAYAVCLNSVPMEEAMALTGGLPACVEWIAVDASAMPAFLAAHLWEGMAEGVGWKLLPLRLWPERHELSLDNDCVLWAVPEAMQQWFGSGKRTLMAADSERCLGRFQEVAAVPVPINSGIRGLPPGFDLGVALQETLAEEEARTGAPVVLESELDEQGMQAVALHRDGPALVVGTKEVSICSPFWPRQPEMGACGAHFVGLNSRHIPWDYFETPGDVVRREHFDRHRAVLYAHAGMPLEEVLPLDEVAARRMLLERGAPARAES